MKRFLIIIASSLLVHASNAQYTLVWSDEFSGDSLDLSTWTHEIGGTGWGNNESQYYTNSPSNSSVANGFVTITARQETVGSNQYTSARLISKDKRITRFGKIEARLKVPMGQGLWPAFWMMGNNFSTVGWPYCGEIDVMEHINNELLTHGTAHWHNGGHIYQGAPIVNNSPNEFHTYAVVWDATKIQWLLDGSIFYGLNIANGVNGTSEFQEDFFMLLNLAVGGNWPGYPNASTVFPAEYVIDYVRIYKSNSELEVTENEWSQVKIFPNPANEFLILQNIPDGKTGTLELLNLGGKTCLMADLNENQKQLNIANLESGVYFLKFTAEDGSVHYEKIIIE